jgi:endoribonuclease LACTB2
VLASESARLGRSVKITKCVLSHWHHDHVGGVGELAQICTEFQDSRGEGSVDRGDEDAEEDELKIYKYPLYDTRPDSDSKSSTREREMQLLQSANDDQPLLQIHDLHDGQILSVGSPNSPDSEQLRLQVIHTPGHTSDHVALIIIASPADQDEVGTIFTGDAVLGHGTAVFEHLAQYMASLEKMKSTIEARNIASDGQDHDRHKPDEGSRHQSRTIKAFPAHGAPILDAKAKLEAYISHRAMREREVLSVLATGRKSLDAGQAGSAVSNAGDWTPMQIVKVVYKDVPESLHVAAEGGVVQVLSKLESEGRIQRMGQDGEESNSRWRIVDRGRNLAEAVTEDREGNAAL